MVVGCWLLVAGCWLLATARWLSPLAFGFWLLAIGSVVSNEQRATSSHKPIANSHKPTSCICLDYGITNPPRCLADRELYAPHPREARPPGRRALCRRRTGDAAQRDRGERR